MGTLAIRDQVLSAAINAIKIWLAVWKVLLIVDVLILLVAEEEVVAQPIDTDHQCGCDLGLFR